MPEIPRTYPPMPDPVQGPPWWLTALTFGTLAALFVLVIVVAVSHA